MSNINDIIACTLDIDRYNTYEKDFKGFEFNNQEEDLDKLEELLKDF